MHFVVIALQFMRVLILSPPPPPLQKKRKKDSIKTIEVYTNYIMLL